MRAWVLAVLTAGAAWCADPADWVPMRWNSTDVKTLAVLEGTPVNCLLMQWTQGNATDVGRFAAAAEKRGIAVLGLAGTGAGVVRDGKIGAPVVEIGLRAAMKFGGDAPVLATSQGVWPGIRVGDSAHAGPTGGAWIDTNAGFLGFARAWGPHAVWIANLPPAKESVTAERYMHAIGDAAIAGARWVVALDGGFEAKLHAGDAAALAKWRRIAEVLRYYEDHADWRRMRSGAQLAIVQAAGEGALVSGGILDMIATQHTPVQAVPPERLTAEAMRGRKLAVDVDARALKPGGKEVLAAFQKEGGAVMNGPEEWRSAAPPESGRFTLTEAEMKRVDDLWKEMSIAIGRRNMGVRLFNVSSMLSNLLMSEDGAKVVVELVNYSDYPVENVTMHVLGKFTKAVLTQPGGKRKDLEVYPVEEGTGVDLDGVGVAAAVELTKQ